MTMEEFHALLKNDPELAATFGKDPVGTMEAKGVKVYSLETKVVYRSLSDDDLDSVAGGAQRRDRTAPPPPIQGSDAAVPMAYNFCGTAGCVGVCANSGYDHATPNPVPPSH